MEHIEFVTSAEGLTPDAAKGFFVGWPTAPSPEKFVSLLQNSDYRILAMDGEKLVGFITAITDRTLAAYIPFLETLPEYQRKGIGQELVKRMLELLKEYYMVDLLCDTDLQPFYEKLGMSKAPGMMIRNYSSQGGI